MSSSLDKDQFKICILTSVHPPFDHRIFYKEAKTLIKAGYNVVLIAQHSQEETVDGVRIVPLPTPKNRFERMTKVVWKLFKLALKEKADVYHFHDLELIPSGLFLKILGKQVIYDIHEDFPEVTSTREWLPKFLRKPLKIIIRYVEKFAFIFFDGLVFTTEGHVKKSGNTDRKQVVLYNYPSINVISSIPLDSVKKYDLVHLGTIHTWRMRFMLKVGEAVKKTRPDFSWIFIGIDKDTIEWAEENMPPELKENYVFIQKRTYFEALALTSQAKIGFSYHPPGSRFEVLIPVKVFEYMALGLPIVSANMDELSKLLSSYNEKIGFLISENTPDRFAEKIEILLSSEDKARDMGKFNQELCQSHFNWSGEASKLIKFYEEVLNDRKKVNNKC
ncbi:MAG: glycosyltransferase [Sedimentisphaerales bacterium]